MLLVSFCFLWTFLVLCGSSGFQNYVVQADPEAQDAAWPESTITKYTPTWESLDSRPLPSWYDDAKFGIFIHWGVFSVPSFGSEWFWQNWQGVKSPKYQEFMKQRYPPNFTYQDFGRDFTAEFFNATQWSEMFKASGAKYIVLTSKHHEGYTLWPSAYSFSWNSMDVGPKKDLIGELEAAIKGNTDIKFGLYHSLYEWFNPLYLSDKKNNFKTDVFVRQKIIPELRELVEKYKPEIVWSDGDWEAPDVYWKSKEFLAWLYNESPVKDSVVANDRWGQNIMCHHGDIYTCSDRFNPGKLIKHKWENCMTIDRKSWGFRRNADITEYFTLKELVKELVTTVSCGGNLLMNVGPTKDGIISPIFEERLLGMGKWLAVNGEAIYNTKYWTTQNDTLAGNVWYTQSKDGSNLYAHVLDWPDKGVLHLKSLVPVQQTEMSLLGYAGTIEWKQEGSILNIILPAEAHNGQPAWVLKITPRP